MTKITCDPKLLRQIVRQDREQIDDPLRRQIESHLSDCPACRSEMEALAGQPQFWKSAAAALADSSLSSCYDLENERPDCDSRVFVEVDPSITASCSELFSPDGERAMAEGHTASRLLLDPPSHPEMLGRIDGFSVERMIGRGGMGVVYKGFDAELNRPVAIKFLSPHLATSGVARQRFAREARAAAAVVHANVVPIYSVNSSPVRPYFVMAIVSGRSLQRHVEEHGPLPLKDVVRISQQVAAGLAAAHSQGLIHRDIKPANILLEKDVSRVMITDFGLARAADDAALTQTGWLAGTPHYMSPEQASGDEIDHRSDLFSLGSAMYFMATGREPFRAERSLAVLQKIASSEPPSPRSINSDVPTTLESIIETLLAKSPDDRFETAAEVQDVLTRYLAWLQDPKSHSEPIIAGGNNGQRKSFSPLMRSIGVLACLFATIAIGYAATHAVSNWRSPERAMRVGTGNRFRPNSPVESPVSIDPWVFESPDKAQWQTAVGELNQQLNRMEQLAVDAPVRADPFTIEKRKLGDRIEQAERSFGIPIPP